MKKLRKSKISKIKRNNQTRTKLSKQGKLKTQRHKPRKQSQKSVPPRPEIVEEKEESDHGQDVMDMIEKDDINFLSNAISNKSYNFLKQIHDAYNDQNERKRKKTENDQPLEELFENNVSKIVEETGGKSVRMLLPIKTQSGFLKKRIVEEDSKILNNEENEHINDTSPKESQEDDNQQENSDMEINIDTPDQLKVTDRPVSLIEFLVHHKEEVKIMLSKIGILSSGILENPDQKCGNLKILLSMLDSQYCITVRRTAMLSLAEIFKDLLPSYNIQQISQEGVKLKKDTLARQNYEATLLRYYKSYLQNLEKISKILGRKKGDTRSVDENKMKFGELAIRCMCFLLGVHPYFNFSVNISTYLIPLLDIKRRSTRELVALCISQVFKEDKRGELSLTIVRKLNQYIKSRKHCVHSEVMTVLLSLRIKDINLDKEKEEETKQKKLMSHKQRILALSRQERKKSKKLEEVEKEMLETKAEENKQAKHKILTEITSIVFTIYFRILKSTANSKILSVCLEGLAKFAHCININFYHDLVNVIYELMDSDLGLKEQLHCSQCLLTIIFGQVAVLNVDPDRFYDHLYKTITKVHCGRTHPESEIVLKMMLQLLIHQRRRITQDHKIVFTKKLSRLALQTQHNATLGFLGIIKQVMQLEKAARVLLDTEYTGDGRYKKEIEEIEEIDYSTNAYSALYELAALQRHYHSPVRQLAKNIACNVPTSGEGSLSINIAKLTPEELYTGYDPAGVAFKPAVPIPKKTTIKKPPIKYSMDPEFEASMKRIADMVYKNDVKKNFLDDGFTIKKCHNM